tara:strand:+ start:173 stop:652 length:480 start_codon:yes stop_codon:yes gene_type:complete
MDDKMITNPVPNCKQPCNQTDGFTTACGNSGWLKHRGMYETNLGSKYASTVCKEPQLLNPSNTDLTRSECINQCKNDPQCDYLTFGQTRGDKNRECNPRWNKWNRNLSYPTGIPCIPPPGKKNCDMCFMYNVKNIPGTNVKQPIKTVENCQFDTLVKNK